MSLLSFNQARKLTSEDIREKIRSEVYINHTSGLAADKLQANIVILPKQYADDFSNFCKLNSKACPLVGQTKLNDPYFNTLGTDIDIRSDVPLYNVYKDGNLSCTVRNIKDIWKNNLIAFAIGCSFSFEQAGMQISDLPFNSLV